MSHSFKTRKAEIRRIQKQHGLYKNNTQWKEHYAFKKEKKRDA